MSRLHQYSVLGKSHDDAETIASGQAVLQLLESLYQDGNLEYSSEPTGWQDTMAQIWSHLDTELLIDLTKEQVLPEKSGAIYAYNQEHRIRVGKVMTSPADIIIFAKSRGHFVQQKAQVSHTEVSIDVTMPESHELSEIPTQITREDIHNWSFSDCATGSIDLFKTKPSIPRSLDCSESPASNELYNKLPTDSWIRVLIIEPGLPSDTLQCHLLPIQLHLAKSLYEALSYCWMGKFEPSSLYSPGEPWEMKVNIICSGLHIFVSQNLGVAIRQIRHPTLRRVIWADALCINQGDSLERSQQVSIMGSIYRNALRTLIWLAKPTVDREVAIQKGLNAICTIVNSWDERQPAEYSYYDSETGSTIIHNAKNETVSKDVVNDILWGIFNHDWFHRRWVIQEVVLSQSAELLIGSYGISWRWVGLASALLRTRYSHIMNDSAQGWLKRHAMNSYFMFRLSSQCDLPRVELSLLQLLRLTASFKNSEPLDTIFALRGLLNQVNGIDGLHQIEVDYSLSEDQLRRQIAELLIAQEKKPLDMLTEAGTSPISNSIGYRESENAISWLPRWTKKARALLGPWAFGDGFNAAHGLNFQRFPACNPLHLAVKGIIVSTAMWRGPYLSTKFYTNHLPGTRWTSDHGRKSFDNGVFGILNSGAFASEDCAPEERFDSSVLQVFARVLTAGRDSHDKREADPKAPLASFAAMLRSCAGGDSGLLYKVLAGMAGDADPREFIQIAGNVADNRIPFVTLQGQLGIGPAEMQVGDVICVLGGAGMPFVLRHDNSEGGGLRYKLIGECFVDGMMDGEAVSAMKKGSRFRGPFDPRRVFEKLYKFPSLKSEGKVLVNQLMDEALLAGEQSFEKLEARTIEIR